MSNAKGETSLKTSHIGERHTVRYTQTHVRTPTFTLSHSPCSCHPSLPLSMSVTPSSDGVSKYSLS